VATAADIPEANDGWIAWAGGECPVVVGERYQTRHRGPSVSGRNDAETGYIYPPYQPAKSGEGGRWAHSGNNHDIIAYRVVQS
jgi:hypothetical protein